MRSTWVLVVLVACEPAIPDAVEAETPRVEEGDAACVHSFAASEAWVAEMEPYGNVRGLNAFVDARTYVISDGIYDARLYTLNVGSGEVEASDAMRPSLLIDRRGDLVLEQDREGVRLRRDEVEIWRAPVDRQFSSVRPQALLTDDHLVARSCSERGELGVERWTFEGEAVSSSTVDEPCEGWLVEPIATDGRRVVTASGLRGLVFDPDGSVLKLSAHEPSLTGELRHAVTDVAFSPDGAQVATAGVDGRLRIHDAASGEVVGVRNIDVVPVNRFIYAEHDVRGPFAWSADGRFLARGTEDGVIAVERVCDGEVLAELEQRDDLGFGGMEDVDKRTFKLEFSPDGRFLLARYARGVQAFEVEAE